MILIDPEGDVAEYVLHFEFSTTNNETKYKVLLARLKVVREMGSQCLKIFRVLPADGGTYKG